MEMLQARGEWQKIFQVKRTRGLDPRLLYPARLSIKIEGQMEFPREKKSKRRQLHQTSSARDAKGTALRKEGKEKDRGTQVGNNGNE